MIFRTEIDIPKVQPLNISHEDGIVMLGSCFTDNIGGLLHRDGFRVTHNPMGPLYNPESILNAVTLALHPEQRDSLIIKTDDQGQWHCLNFATKYTDKSKDLLLEKVYSDLDKLKHEIEQARIIIITLGTSYIFKLSDGVTVGNCHKFPSKDFTRERLCVSKMESLFKSLVEILPQSANVIFTVSPIRHTADGLHGNEISKAALHLSLDGIIDSKRIQYFPAYEIMIDDLRDYRFYASDLKHPSETAVEYIYEIFAKYYFTKSTIEQAQLKRKESQRLAHRQILPE